MASAIHKFTDYYSRHGLRDTLRRSVLEAKRLVFANRMAVFFCDLQNIPADSFPPNSEVTLHRVHSYAELSCEDVARMTSLGKAEAAVGRFHERFGKGASLWLARCPESGRIAGFGWSLQGRTMEPYYLVVGERDVHFFDFHVFEEYRGKGLNPLLVNYILRIVAKEANGFAFIDAAEWNKPQLASLKRTAFRFLGLIRTTSLFGHRYQWWEPKNCVSQHHLQDSHSH